MALPIAPTITSICQEALLKIYTNIPSAIQSRAETEWIEGIKNEIFLTSSSTVRKLKPLFVTAYTATTKGLHRYSNPSDYSDDLNLTLLDGSNTGIAQTGAAGSITLAANEDITEGNIVGKYILVTSGTGVDSCSQCITYSTTTKIAAVSPNFTTAPAASSGYMVIDTTYKLERKEISWHDTMMPTSLQRPLSYYPIGSNTYGEFILYPTPDKTYGLQLRYYINLLRIDLSSTLMTTLYERWRSVFVQGVYIKALQNIDDPNTNKEKKLFYDITLPGLIDRETFTVDYADLQLAPKI